MNADDFLQMQKGSKVTKRGTNCFSSYVLPAEQMGLGLRCKPGAP